MYVVSRPLRDARRIVRIAGSLGTLTGIKGVKLDAPKFWRHDLNGPMFVKCYLLILKPDMAKCDPYDLCRRVIAYLEEKHGVILCWAAGARKYSVWLLIKSQSLDNDDRACHFRPDVEDFEAIRQMAPGPHKSRKRARVLVRER